MAILTALWLGGGGGGYFISGLIIFFSNVVLLCLAYVHADFSCDVGKYDVIQKVQI